MLTMWRLCKIEWNIKGNKRSDFVAVARTFAVLIEVYSFFGGGLSIEIIINGFSAFFTLLSMDDKSMVRMSEMKFTHIVRLPLKLSKCSIFDVMDTHTLTHTHAPERLISLFDVVIVSLDVIRVTFIFIGLAPFIGFRRQFCAMESIFGMRTAKP